MLNTFFYNFQRLAHTTLTKLPGLLDSNSKLDPTGFGLWWAFGMGLVISGCSIYLLNWNERFVKELEQDRKEWAAEGEQIRAMLGNIINR